MQTSKSQVLTPGEGSNIQGSTLNKLSTSQTQVNGKSPVQQQQSPTRAQAQINQQDLVLQLQVNQNQTQQQQQNVKTDASKVGVAPKLEEVKESQVKTASQVQQQPQVVNGQQLPLNGSQEIKQVADNKTATVKVDSKVVQPLVVDPSKVVKQEEVKASQPVVDLKTKPLEAPKKQEIKEANGVTQIQDQSVKQVDQKAALQQQQLLNDQSAPKIDQQPKVQLQQNKDQQQQLQTQKQNTVVVENKQAPIVQQQQIQKSSSEVVADPKLSQQVLSGQKAQQQQQVTQNQQQTPVDPKQQQPLNQTPQQQQQQQTLTNQQSQQQQKTPQQADPKQQVVQQQQNQQTPQSLQQPKDQKVLNQVTPDPKQQQQQQKQPSQQQQQNVQETPDKSPSKVAQPVLTQKQQEEKDLKDLNDQIRQASEQLEQQKLFAQNEERVQDYRRTLTVSDATFKKTSEDNLRRCEELKQQCIKLKVQKEELELKKLVADRLKEQFSEVQISTELNQKRENLLREVIIQREKANSARAVAKSINDQYEREKNQHSQLIKELEILNTSYVAKLEEKKKKEEQLEEIKKKIQEKKTFSEKLTLSLSGKVTSVQLQECQRQITQINCEAQVIEQKISGRPTSQVLQEGFQRMLTKKANKAALDKQLQSTVEELGRLHKEQTDLSNKLQSNEMQLSEVQSDFEKIKEQNDKLRTQLSYNLQDQQSCFKEEPTNNGSPDKDQCEDKLSLAELAIAEKGYLVSSLQEDKVQMIQKLKKNLAEKHIEVDKEISSIKNWNFVLSVLVNLFTLYTVLLIFFKVDALHYLSGHVQSFIPEMRNH